MKNLESFHWFFFFLGFSSLYSGQFCLRLLPLVHLTWKTRDSLSRVLASPVASPAATAADLRPKPQKSGTAFLLPAPTFNIPPKSTFFYTISRAHNCIFKKKRFSEFVASVCRWVSLLGVSDTQFTRLEVEHSLGRQVYLKLFFWVGVGGPIE